MPSSTLFDIAPLAQARGGLPLLVQALGDGIDLGSIYELANLLQKAGA